MSFSSCAMVVSTVDDFPFCVLFSNLSVWVCAIALLVVGVSDDCVRDIVLRAGAVVWTVVLWFLFCVYVFFVDCSTLGTDGVENGGDLGFGCVIDIVFCVLLLAYIVTLELAGSHVVVVGVVEIGMLCCIACSIIWIIWLIYSDPLLLPNSFIDLAHSDIAAIAFSACVMVGWVRFFLLKCIVSVKLSLLVDFMWHLCVC